MYFRWILSHHFPWIIKHTSCRDKMLSRLHLLQFYLASPPKSSLTCSDTTDKDKSTLYFSIDCLYEEIFKNGQTDEFDDIIYIDRPSLEFKKWINHCILNPTVLRIFSNNETGTTNLCFPLGVTDKDFSLSWILIEVLTRSQLLHFKEEMHHHFINQLHREPKNKLNKTQNSWSLSIDDYRGDQYDLIAISWIQPVCSVVYSTVVFLTRVLCNKTKILEVYVSTQFIGYTFNLIKDWNQVCLTRFASMKHENQYFLLFLVH